MIIMLHVNVFFFFRGDNMVIFVFLRNLKSFTKNDLKYMKNQ